MKLTIDPYQLIDKYYSKERQLKTILIAHSKSVAKKTLQIAELHPELNLDKVFLVEASLLHDIGIFMTNAPDILCFGNAPYIAHGYLGSDILKEEGLLKHALVCERHTGTGLSLKTIKEHNLPIPKRDMLPVTLEEQVICFADKFYSKSNILQEKSVKQARESLEKFGDGVVNQFDIWTKAFL